MSAAAALDFFDRRTAEHRLYEALEKEVRSHWPEVEIKVQKTQIRYSDPRPFLWVWLPIRPVKGRPDHYLVVTFGSPVPIEDPRIVEKTRIRDHRWTHHVLVAKAQDIDPPLIAWIETSHAMSKPTRA